MMTATVMYLIMMLTLCVYVFSIIIQSYKDSKKKKEFTWFDYKWSLDKNGNIIVHWDELRHDIEWYKDHNYDMETLGV